MAIRKIPADTATFHYYNANPKNHRAPDCVIRAICTATGDTWEDTLMGLTEVALKMKSVPNDKKVFDKYLESKGWFKRKQPRKADGTKYTGAEFAERFGGTFVANLGGEHTVCVKGHQVWDTWNSTGKCIGNIWCKGFIDDRELIQAIAGKGK